MACIAGKLQIDTFKICNPSQIRIQSYLVYADNFPVTPQNNLTQEPAAAWSHRLAGWHGLL